MLTQEPSNQISQSLVEHLLHVTPNEEIMRMLTPNNDTNNLDISTASTSSLIHSGTDDLVVEERDGNNLGPHSQKSLQVQLIEEVRKFPCIWDVSAGLTKKNPRNWKRGEESLLLCKLPEGLALQQWADGTSLPKNSSSASPQEKKHTPHNFIGKS